MTITVPSVLPSLSRLLSEAIEDERTDDARALAVATSFVALAARAGSSMKFDRDHLELLIEEAIDMAVSVAMDGVIEGEDTCALPVAALLIEALGA